MRIKYKLKDYVKSQDFIGLKYGNCYSAEKINLLFVCVQGMEGEGVWGGGLGGRVVGEYGFPYCRNRGLPLPAKDFFISPPHLKQFVQQISPHQGVTPQGFPEVLRT